MQIHAVGGNIADRAPEIAEAAVLWLRSGYNYRHHAWRFKISERYWDRLRRPAFPMIFRRGHLPEAAAIPTMPWVNADDVVFNVDPPDHQLRYIYLFANSTDGTGYQDLQEVDACIHRSLNRLTELSVRKVAMMHVPVIDRLSQDRNTCDRRSAKAMLTAIRAWDELHPNAIDDIFLVDLQNSFEELFPES